MSGKTTRLVGPAISGAILCAALVLVGIAAFVQSQTASAAGLAQSATPTPSAMGSPTQLPVTSDAVTDSVSYDPAGDLTSAAINLHAGFIMDPYLLPVVGKSEKPATAVVKGCNGYLAAEPGVVINWTGKTDQLHLFVYSDADPVLAVQKPDGSFICNDDAGARTVEPLLTIKDPAPGAYKVFAGTAYDGQPALGFLAITQAPLDAAKLADLDLGPMLRRRAQPKPPPIEQLDPKTLLMGRAAIFGSTDLKAGFKPVQVFAAGGGDIGAVRIEDGNLTCAGYITAVPSYAFAWTGTPQAMRLFFEGLNDSSLVVITPDQKVLCGMNAAAVNLNPVVDIPSPAEGQYRVYVAAMQPSSVVAGKLTITADTKALPAVLKSNALTPGVQ